MKNGGNKADLIPAMIQAAKALLTFIGYACGAYLVALEALSWRGAFGVAILVGATATMTLSVLYGEHRKP